MTERIEIHARVARDTSGLDTYVLAGQRVNDLMAEHYGHQIKFIIEQLPDPVTAELRDEMDVPHRALKS
jgi:hypothetical protein